MTDAVSKGAEVLVGGARNEDLGPLFYCPSVAVGVSQEMKVTNEETFGPLAAIMRCVAHVCMCCPAGHFKLSVLIRKLACNIAW